MTSEPQTTELDDSERTRCEIWSRVMGYYRPVSQWNVGKQSEHCDRIAFREPPACVPDASGQMKLGV